MRCLLPFLAILALLAASPTRAAPSDMMQPEHVTLPGPEGVTLKAKLFLPAGPRITSAIVALHGCGGPFPARDAQWAEKLAAMGHAVLLPDSFGSRNLGPQCRERARLATARGLRRQDAIAAARWLAERPGTPAGGIVLMGWSDGGSTVIATAGNPHDIPPGLFRGFVAFYPGCRAAAADATWKPQAPLLILHGESDDWTPIAPCRALAERDPGQITLLAYPGAYHDFDLAHPVRVLRMVPTSQNPDGTVHVGGNEAGRADALARVPEFIAGLPAR